MDDSQNSSLSEASIDTCTDYASGEHSGALISNFEAFRMEGGYSDLTINVGKRKFPCHRVILAAGSSYFKSMFSSGMEESWKNPIELRQIDGDVFELVLHFIYTGHVRIASHVLEELFTQAYMFQINPLVDLCVEFFKENMNETNCLAAYTLADTHAHRQLFEYSKEFSCTHFKSVAQDEDFGKLSLECVTGLLRDRRLQCDGEEDVFRAAIKWLNTEGELDRRKSCRNRVLECVKFPLMKQSYLVDVVSKSLHVTQDEKCSDLLENAIKFHTIPTRRALLPSFQITPRISHPVFESAILLGGRLADGLSNDVECYNSYTRDFSSLKQLPFKKRNEFAACVVGDDIYVSGGLRSGEFWKYDNVFETWTRGTNLLNARRRHAMSAVDDAIFVLGGFDEDLVLDSVEMWQRNLNQWNEVGTLCHAVENMGYISYGKDIYLFGGKNNDEIVTNTVQCFNTGTLTSTVLTRSLPASDMCLSAAILNSYIYVIGLEGAFRYSPQTEDWEILPDMSCARDFVSLSVLDEKLYAFGGRRRGAKDNLYTNTIELFDPERNAWEIVGTIPVPMYSYGCVRIFLSHKDRNQ